MMQTFLAVPYLDVTISVVAQNVTNIITIVSVNSQSSFVCTNRAKALDGFKWFEIDSLPDLVQF